MLLTMQQQEALVSQKLAIKKVCGDYVTYKYAKRVMYDYLWDKHPELLECRGHTYNIHTGELVLCPTKKSFNYLENGTWQGVSLDTPVIAFRKYNGFMASARIVNDELLVATTGTTNQETSQYVGWAKREIGKFTELSLMSEWYGTSVFEIVIPEDPHIVDDGVTGAIHLLQRTHINEGMYLPVGQSWETTLGDVLAAAKEERHEGWMVYDAYQYKAGIAIPSTCKIKTDYYVGKKKLMRASGRKAGAIWASLLHGHDFDYLLASLPKQWHGIVKNLRNTSDKELWIEMTDQERRAVIESMEKEYYD